MMTWAFTTMSLANAGVGATIDALAPLRSLREVRDVAEPPRSTYDALGDKAVSGIVRVTGTHAKAWGAAIVKAPIEEVWMAVNDESRMAGRLPVSVSQVIGGTAHQSSRRVFELMPLPIVSDRWWVVDMHFNTPLYTASKGRMWELHWTDATDAQALSGTAVEAVAARGYPVNWTTGSWLMVDLGDGRTLVEYYTWSDPGGSIPAGASRFAGGAVRDTLDAIRLLAQENAGRSRAGFTRPDGSPL